MPPRKDVVAAGAVVFRPGREVLLVHRPRYDDWSFPKGKLDPGEAAPVAAVREIDEETGVHVRLGPPLTGQRYPMADGRCKDVHYWVGWPVGDDDVSGYAVNEEIDEVAWVPYDAALEKLTYDRDRDTLREARGLRKKTHALVVLRHAKARSRKGWTSKPDEQRPLVSLGHDQAQRLVALLAVFDTPRILSSSSERCVQTLQPYADATEWDLERRRALSEEGATDRKVTKAVAELLEGTDGAVVCTHRPVLPLVCAALGVPETTLDPAGILVVHHRKGTVVATEVHARP